MNSLLIKGGRVIDPAQKIDAEKDIIVENGRIKDIVSPGAVSDENYRQLDASGQWILPGLIDMHVHLREPGYEYKETIKSGAEAAAAGGFTTILAMPNTKPTIDSAEQISSILKKARGLKAARVLVAGAMTRASQGEELNEYEDMKEAGASALTDDGVWVPDAKVFRRVLDYAFVCGLVPLSHAEDHALSKGGVMHEGLLSTRMGLAGIPAQAEINAVMRDINMVELTGRPLHFCHISTKGAVEAIRRAKAQGLPISAETAPHYLFLTHEDVKGYSTNAKMNPPLRSEEDKQALREALADGSISVIATDHAPHSVLEKDVEFVDAAFGIIGLQSSLPLMLQLLREELISPFRLVELMSLNPATILNLDAGDLRPGRPADISIVDSEQKYIYTPEDSKSLSKNSPFWGHEFIGCAKYTIVAGEIVFQAPKPQKDIVPPVYW